MTVAASASILSTASNPDACEMKATKLIVRGEKQLRVLHLGRVGFVGGAERVMLTIAADAAKRQGIETFLACPPGQLANEARSLGIQPSVIAFSRMRITLNPFRYIAYAASLKANSYKLYSLCRDLQIDVIHVHHPVTALYCERAIKRLGVPLVLHLHEGLPARPLYKLALRHAARLAAKVVCVSSAGLSLLQASGASSANALIVHNGVVLPDSKRSEPTKRNALEIAVIGFLEPRKGQDVFIEAVAAIADAYPGMRCSIIGDQPVNGASAYKRKLRERVAALGLDRTIQFVPYTSDIAARMDAFDIVVSSSVGLESLSLVMMEAMAQGCVVVSTKLGGIGDLINDGVNGFLAEAGCAKSLSRGIESAIKSDRQVVGKSASKTIAARFSIQQMCDGVANVYQEVAISRAPAVLA